MCIHPPEVLGDGGGGGGDAIIERMRILPICQQTMLGTQQASTLDVFVLYRIGSFRFVGFPPPVALKVE